MDIIRRKANTEYIVLQKAAKITGYASDYIGWLIRTGKVKGKRVYTQTSWQIKQEELIKYCQKHKNLDLRDFYFLKKKYSEKKYLSLKEAAEISGYAFDYIGWLIRTGKVKGKRVYTGISWQTTEEAIKNYQKRKTKTKGKIFFNLPSYLKSIHLIPESGNKVFGFGWRLSLTALIIFFLVSGFAPIKFLHSSLISAITAGETKTINYYSAVSYGDWQNPENVQVLPEVGPSGDINSFNENNSTVYKSGPLYLVSENFTTDEDFTNYNFQSAKIKISFAIGEKESDIQIIENQEIEPVPSESEPTGFWNKVKNFLVVKAEEGRVENGSLPAEETITAEATATEPILEETITTEEAATTETTTTPEITERPTTEASLPDLDTQIIIWWSLDGENWQQLVTISDYPLSNFLNGDYFEYEASFLKDFEDVKNLKIKFEGVVGSETNIVAYLDSVWVEVEYKEEKEEEEEEFELIAIKNDWRADETPEFEIVPKGERTQENIIESLIAEVSSIFEEEPKVEATLIGPNREESLLQEGEDFSSETHSPTRIRVFKQEGFRPGLHRLKIEYEKNGKVYNLETEFTWGVLAINTNKSIYLPDETAYLQMAVLKEDGHTICDANLKLEVISPDGEPFSVPVQKSGECGPNNVTSVPDYFAYYQVGEPGIYEMKLTNLDNGYEITDSFEVRDSVPFDVERIGPTRIYPPATYEMVLKINTNEDFQGEIREFIPNSFVINSETSLNVHNSNEEKIIIWEVNWKAGETHELKYTFDAPDISPYLYLVGPLKIGDFQEIRQWQIAADANTFRVTEYWLTTGAFTGTTYDLTLNQDLADEYFILVRGSRVDSGNSNPDNDFIRVYEVPGGKGDLPTSGASNVVALSRHVADFTWEGVVTVVECLGDCLVSGFTLLDIAETSLTNSTVSGTDTSGIAWGSSIDQVVLFGGTHGGGAEFEVDAAADDGNAAEVRLYPTDTDTINWERNSSMSLLATKITTFVVKWGLEWEVQHVYVTATIANSPGCDATGEYNTGALSPSVVRDNTWVWGTGNSTVGGIGDAMEGTIITLGDGVTQLSTESVVSWCGEYASTRNMDIYAITHTGLAVDYRFKVEGDTGLTDVNVTVDDATPGYRFAWVTNSCVGSGNAHPRDRFSARYTADGTEDTVTLSRGQSGQNFPAWVEGIDFSGITYTPVDATIISIGSQNSSMDVPSSNNYVGGMFTIVENTSSRNVTGITITEYGSVDAQNDLSNIELWYDFDTSDPYICDDVSYEDGATQFGSASSSFSGADGTADFDGSVGISTTQSMCVYVVLDVDDTAGNGDDIEIKINDPSTDVKVSSGATGPIGSAAEISGTTYLYTLADLQQLHYRWRYDNGGEVGWWDDDWSYKKEITIDNTGNSNVLTDFQVFIEIDDSQTDFWANTQPDGDDVRFVNPYTGNTELDYLLLYWDDNTEATFWVKVDSIPSSSFVAINMYYGNSICDTTSNAEDTFGYATRENRFVSLGDYNETGSYAMSFFDGNDFIIDNNPNTASSSFNTAIRMSIANGDINNGSIASSTKPVAISGNVASGEMWTPFAWQATDLYTSSYDVANPEIDIYNPNDTAANINVYYNGGTPTSFSIPAYSVDGRSYTGAASGHWRISSDIPVMAFMQPSTNRIHSVPPPAREWWGHYRQTVVLGTEDYTSTTVYFSNDGTPQTNSSIGATTYWLVGAGDQYGITAAYASSTKPILVFSSADGNGSDNQVWYSKEDLDTEYLIPDDYDYMSVSTPYANTTIHVYTISGGSWVEATSGPATRTGSDPNPYWWKDTTARIGGVKVTANNPIYVYYDQTTGVGDENNAANRVINRKGAWPRPFVSLIGSEYASQGDAAAFILPEDAGLADFETASTTRLRFLISNDGGQSTTTNYQIEWAKNDTCSAGSYSAVPTDYSEDWHIATSTYITDGQSTSNILDQDLFDALTDPGGKTFVNGELKDTGNTTGNITLSTTQFTEIEYAILAVEGNAEAGAQYCFRLSASGVTTNFTYNIYATSTMAVTGITISGTVYTDEGQTGIGSGKLVRLKVNGLGNSYTATTTATSSYSISNVTINNPGDVITVFLDGTAEKAVTVTRASSTTANIEGLHFYQNRIIVRHEDSGPITITDLDKYDSGEDQDILFTASSTAGTLIATTTSEFFVWPGSEFRAGPAAGTLSFSDLDIRGTFTATSTQTISVSGSWFASSTATFTAASSTITFIATTTGKTITTAGNSFYNLTFNGSNGGWTFQDSATSTNNWNINNAQSFAVASSITIEVKGNYIISDSIPSVTIWNSGSVLYLNSSSSYTVGSKNQDAETYATLKIGANTDIRTWDSTSTSYDVDPSGSLYSQDHGNNNGYLYVWGNFHTTSTDYWSYTNDFDGASVSRQCQATINSGASITIDSGATLEIKGGGNNSSDITQVSYAPATGSWNLNNNSGSELVFQEATIEYMKVNSGTVTVLNTTLNNEVTPADGTTLNVDWYLGGHIVDAASTSTDIADATTTVSSTSTSDNTVWKWSGSGWGDASTSQTTLTNASGLFPQPGTDGAIRIREYSATSTATTYYKYNLAITANGFSDYDYYDDQDNNYITSASSSESSNVDKCISENWQRDDIDVNNTPESTINYPPNNGTWYAGMNSDLQFTVYPTTVDFVLLDDFNELTATATTILYATTSYSDGYKVTAYAYYDGYYDGTLRLDADNYIERWNFANSTPEVWPSTCWNDSQCGFGYTTSDTSLGPGYDDRFANGTKYAGFATSTPGDRVADEIVAVPGGSSYTITYKVSAPPVTIPGDYQTTVYYLCTVNY